MCDHSVHGCGGSVSFGVVKKKSNDARLLHTSWHEDLDVISHVELESTP